MLKYTCLVVAALVMPLSTAVAEDWTGQTPPPILTGPAGALHSPLAYGNPLYSDQLLLKCFPSYRLAPCGGGETQIYYPAGTAGTTLSSIPATAGAPGSNVHINVTGEYSDPTSPTGFSELYGTIPLSAFARSSTVDDLASQFSTQVNQMQQQLMLQDKMALQGVASAIAMTGGADLASDENYAISGNWGTFGGQNAFAGSFAMRAADHLTFSAGVAASVSGGPVGARAGFRFAW